MLVAYSFRRCVATFVAGKLNASFFGYSDPDDVTPVHFYLTESNKIRSIARQVPVDYTVNEMGSNLPPVWKIFSESKFSDKELDTMFANRTETRVFDWLAYPKYTTKERLSLGTFELAPRLYHVNGIELAASAMEMSVIGARNVANMAYEEWTGRKTGSGAETTAGTGSGASDKSRGANTEL